MSEIHPDSDYQAFLKEGRFMIQRSRSTGAYVFYPRVATPGTGVEDLEWVAPSGQATVYSTTVVRNRPPTPDYNVAIIELAEGPHMMSRVVGVEPTAVTIGMKVKARVGEVDGVVAVVFEPVEGQGQ